MFTFEVLFSSFFGQILLVAVIITILAIIYFIAPKKNNDSKNRGYSLTVSAVLMALAFTVNNFPIFKMPQGGSVTLCSMLLLYLIGYFLGVRIGIFAGIAFGLLDLLIDPSAYYPIQVLLDYPIAFALIGTGAFLRDRKSGLYTGYVLGMLGRFVCSFLSGVIFFGEYAPEGYSSIGWSLWYNVTYLGVETALTLVVIFVPLVHNMIFRVKKSFDLMGF